MPKDSFLERCRVALAYRLAYDHWVCMMEDNLGTLFLAKPTIEDCQNHYLKTLKVRHVFLHWLFLIVLFGFLIPPGIILIVFCMRD